jgi:hypothetical protein
MVASMTHRLTALMMEAASTSETLVNLYQTTWCYNSQESHLHCVVLLVDSNFTEKHAASIPEVIIM